MSVATEVEAPSGPTRRSWIALACLCLPVLMISMDVSVLFFAVPFIAQDLQPTATQQLWIFDVYGFVLAGLLMTMGAVADRIGRRRLLMLGALTFSAASLVAAWSTSAEMLIGARVLMGIGGATLMPSTLALVRTVFPDQRARSKAIGIWSAVMAGGIAVGPLLSGVLLEHVFWGAVFLINVPVMGLLLVVAPVLLPESRGSRHPIDVVSALLSLGATLPFIYGVKHLAADGWSWTAAGSVAVGVLLGAAFVARQRTSAAPMLDLALFRNRGFSASVSINLLAQLALMGNSILITGYLQQVLGLRPLVAALWSVAPSLLVGAAAPLAGVVAGRVGRPPVMATGLGLAAVGFLLMNVVRAESSVWVCLAPVTMVAVGLVSVLTLVTEFVVGTVPAERAGAAAGFVETTSEFAGALGIALLGSVVNAVYRLTMATGVPVGVTAVQADRARETLVGAIEVAGTSPSGPMLLRSAERAYVGGMHLAYALAAGLMVVGVVVALTRLPRKVN
jgi:DHA2 family multidrug resistance protein-like MFS transporter